jgi:hypothetical protein
MPFETTLDLLTLRRDDVEESQWPRLSCSQAQQAALAVGDLRLDAGREVLFQDQGQIRSFDDAHKLVFNRAGQLLELHEQGAIRFLTGAPTPAERLRILATGQVGLGTATPTQALDVVGTVRATAFQGNGAALTGVRATDATKVAKAGDTMTGPLTITAAGAGLSITNNAAVGGTLTIGGSVGIGNNTPQERLDVNGRIKSGALSMGPWPANGNYLFFGVNTLDQTHAGNYALLQGSGTDPGRTFLNSPEEIHFRISNVDQLVLNTTGLFGAAKGQGGAELRIAVGRTQPSQWVQYNNDGIYVDVDTSDAGFTQTPYYFTSLIGNTNHWLARGSSSIYLPSPNQFTVYINYGNITAGNANAMGWYINWIAIGI